VQVALMEMHDLGPVKLFDTPGIDEEGLLGEKKRRKAFDVLKVLPHQDHAKPVSLSSDVVWCRSPTGVQRSGDRRQSIQPGFAQGRQGCDSRGVGQAKEGNRSHPIAQLLVPDDVSVPSES
jgi:hypothetical protein